MNIGNFKIKASDKEKIHTYIKAGGYTVHMSLQKTDGYRMYHVYENKEHKIIATYNIKEKEYDIDEYQFI